MQDKDSGEPDPLLPFNHSDNWFNNLFAAHSRAVWGVAYARGLDRDLALDVMQEAFLRLQQQADRQAIENPRAWLIRVARNLAEDWTRGAFYRNRRGGQIPPDASAPGQTPGEAILEQERHEAVREALRQLPVEERELLTWRYTLDWSTEQLAEVLQISPAAVLMRLSRARQGLKQELERKGWGV